MATWIEAYGCGCTEEADRKKDLTGYCAVHGEDRTALYKDGLPADQHTRDVHRELARLSNEGKP